MRHSNSPTFIKCNIYSSDTSTSYAVTMCYSVPLVGRRIAVTSALTILVQKTARYARTYVQNMHVCTYVHRALGESRQSGTYLSFWREEQKVQWDDDQDSPTILSLIHFAQCKRLLKRWTCSKRVVCTLCRHSSVDCYSFVHTSQEDYIL